MKDLKFSLTDSTTFAGKDAEGFYSEALLSGKSAKLFSLVPNVKSKIKLADLNLGNIIQDADCTFSAAGEGTLAQKSFEVAPFKINLSYCKRTFETNYLSAQLRPGSNNDEVMPATIQEYLLSLVAAQTANDLEKITWEGDTTSLVYPYNAADGLVKKFLADSNVIDIASPVAITSSNVIAKTQLVYNDIPETIIDKDDLRIFMAPNVFRAYKAALATASAETNFMQAYNELYFLGTKVELAPGMASNTIVAARLSNLFLLTDLMSDFEDINVLPQSGVTGEPTVRMTAEFKFGVDYMYGSEVVLYRA